MMHEQVIGWPILYNAVRAHTSISTSKAFWMIRIQRWWASSNCRASSCLNDSRTSLNRSVRDICATVSHRLSAVELDRGTNASIWTANDSITGYIFPNSSRSVDEKSTVQYCACLTSEPTATSLLHSFHAEHQVREASPRLAWTKPSRAWTLRGSDQWTNSSDVHSVWRPSKEICLTACVACSSSLRAPRGCKQFCVHFRAWESLGRILVLLEVSGKCMRYHVRGLPLLLAPFPSSPLAWPKMMMQLKWAGAQRK